MRTTPEVQPEFLIASRRRELEPLLAGLPEIAVASNIFRAIGLVAVRKRVGRPYRRLVIDPGLFAENPEGLTPDGVRAVIGSLAPETGIAHAHSEGSVGESRAESVGIAAAGDGPQVLVVDDEESIRDALVEILNFGGYTAECAADGHEAIGRVLYRKALGQEHRVILMDLKLRPDMDGAQAARFIDDQPPPWSAHGSLSYISAFISEVDVDRRGEVTEKGDFRLMHRFEHLRFIRMLNKPVDANDLLALVSEGVSTYEVGAFFAETAGPEDALSGGV